MRKYSFLFTLLLLSASSFAQDKDFSYKFYGQVRTDFYYNSRANEETVDGLFYMYPKDKIYDTDRKRPECNSQWKLLYLVHPSGSRRARSLSWAGQKPRQKWKWTFADQEPPSPPYACAMHI